MAAEGRWRILIVDDEPDVHAITRIVLRETEFEGRSIEFINAFSAEEAKQRLQEIPDISVAIVDVVMETDDAGLLLAKWIREELRNHMIRIILRTGRPGEAPERSVIVDYDINDYREKSELTDARLLTMLISALRSYRDLAMLELSRRGFARIVQASGRLFTRPALSEYLHHVLLTMSELVASNPGDSSHRVSGLAIEPAKSNRIVSALGDYENLIGRSASELPEFEEFAELLETVRNRTPRHVAGPLFAGYFPGAGEMDVVLLLNAMHDLGAEEAGILETFSAIVELAFENLTLSQHVEESQREMIYMLGEAVEKRSKETGSHVKRMARIVGLLGRKLDLPPAEVQSMELGAPLHDVGKIAIPDEILNKPGPLTDDEMRLMKDHTEIGYKILKPHTKGLLRQAAEIAVSHHERWQGQGYPNGLAREDIPISGRIAALADVVDALSHDRPYKDAWPLDRVFAYVEEEAGTQFDPALVELLLGARDEVARIFAEHPDD